MPAIFSFGIIIGYSYYACSADDDFDSYADNDLETLANGSISSAIVHTQASFLGDSISRGEYIDRNLDVGNELRADVRISWTNGYTGNINPNRSIPSFYHLTSIDTIRDSTLSDGLTIYRLSFSFVDVTGKRTNPTVLSMTFSYYKYIDRYTDRSKTSVIQGETKLIKFYKVYDYDDIRSDSIM